jgi:hypothetical protein
LGPGGRPADLFDLVHELPSAMDIALDELVPDLGAAAAPAAASAR